PGGLPANLQGLWNDSNKPPWHSDYHTNINVQMNYWLAEPANLAECHEPLFDLIRSQLEPWRKATQAAKEFQTASGKPRGWTVRTSHGIHGDMAWQWDNTSNAWYGQHFWLHYAFGGDKEYLKREAYPLLKEVCEFWEERLKALPDGRLVIPNGWSPEHGPHEDGVSYSQQIVYDLFGNYIASADALGLDKPPSPPHVAPLRRVPRQPDYRGKDARLCRGRQEIARCARRHRRRARVVVRLAHRALRPPARRRGGPPHVPAVALRPQHVRESLRPAPADADGR
ncbi:MAG: hypothetical protein NT049_05025, partial [Planctomycetota bacterium]|nr:hypothetical protein [Planctomycetota bacterium]